MQFWACPRAAPRVRPSAAMWGQVPTISAAVLHAKQFLKNEPESKKVQNNSMPKPIVKSQISRPFPYFYCSAKNQFRQIHDFRINF